MYYILEMRSDYSLIGTIEIILSLIACYYITIFIHELGHIIGFKVYGYQIILAAVGPIIYTNYKKKIIKFKISNFLIGGGIVPKISKIENEYELKKFIRSYQLSLVLGPIMNLILVFLCILLFKAEIINEYPLFLIITSLLLFIYSFVKAMGVEGDIYIYWKHKADNNLALYGIFEFSLLNDTCNTFLENKIKKIISINSMDDLNYKTITLIGEYIDYCTVNSKKAPIQIDVIIETWIKKYNPLINDKFKFNREHMIILCKLMKNKIVTNSDIGFYKKFYEKHIQDYESNHALLQFYKNKTDFILQLSESNNYLKDVQIFYNEMILEYLIGKHTYINRLLEFDEKAQQPLRMKE
ncbi:hypothetical protein J2T56_003070 [Natronobacillus azotifigens]|uniref:Site-2 protease family protein n=1 Tax=Natronobacillus azotifigens TaxID=472978 RepID=A0A9J6RC47_9BACI|nr:site-2 protease family protein [Natronobacillus azotifigens]MCZ0702785.1 site-2 protease family protein [Natronobacillus azotifigens]